jgi:hypothetical protein
MLEPEQPFNNTHDISWPTTMTDEEILAALLELNLSRPAVGGKTTSEEEGNDDE